MNGEGSLHNLIMIEQFVGELGSHTRHDKYTNKIAEYFNERYNDALTLAMGNELMAFEILTTDVMALLPNIKNALLIHCVEKLDDLRIKVNDLWNDGNVDFSSLTPN